MRPNRVVVVGSYNTDMTIKAARIPQPGETLLGGRFSMGAGGKGANQAVAAARAGAEVSFIGRVGDDTFGEAALKGFRQDDINIDYVVRDRETPTGVACIVVDDAGENSIVVASGANLNLQPHDVAAAKDLIAAADILLLQLESPLETVEAAAQLAADFGVRVMLNPAPARPLPPALLRHLTFITPNEIEAEILTGVKINNEKSWRNSTQALRSQGAAVAIITLGAQGVFVATEKNSFLSPAFKVNVVDTTAAGDIFNGALAAFLSRARALEEAVRMAGAAAALSVTKVGAQASAPFLPDIQKFLSKQPLFASPKPSKPTEA